MLQSVQLPFALIPVLHFTSSKTIMGDFRNHWTVQIVVWLMAFGIIGINVYQVYSFITGWPKEWYIYLPVGILGLGYFAFIGYLVLDRKVWKKLYSKVVGQSKTAPDNTTTDCNLHKNEKI